MVAIIIATPLQLFNATMIMRHHFSGEKADLFVLNIACNMHSLVAKYQKLDYIENVFYLDDVCQHNSRIGIIWDHIHTTKPQRILLSKISTRNYSDLLSTWVGKTSTWLFTKIRKHSPNVNFHYYEEGLGVYLKYIYKTYNGIIKMYSILGYRYEGNYVKDLYIYRPVLSTSNNDITKIPIGFPTNSDIEKLRSVLNLDNISNYCCKAIYFENDFRNTEFEGVDEEEIIDEIISVLGHDEVTVRLHPRTPLDKYACKQYIIDTNINYSWEDILAVEEKWIDKILISLNSTAVFSPMLIYGKEAKVIILGLAIRNKYKDKEWANSFWDKNYSEFVLKVKALYSHPEYIQIPECFEDLKESIDKLK
jgi:hypothetical protein